MRTLFTFLAVAAATSHAAAGRARVVVVPTQTTVAEPAAVNSHILFLNNCQPNGCTVTSSGSSGDSRTDQSSIPTPGPHTLAAFPSNVSWSTVLSCVKGVMAPFNITVTDVDPGTADHFEVMVAGLPQQLGLAAGIGGISNLPPPGGYLPNALAFDFAGTYGTDTLAICGVAAQVIATTWSLDHTIVVNDPLTYLNYTGTLSFHDNAACGSDCVGGMSPLGATCTGSGATATHVCSGTNQSIQNEVQIITALFGPAGTSPTVAITDPPDGAAEPSGTAFPVTATCATSAPITSIDLQIDGVSQGTATASPAMFTAPATLADGGHDLVATCTTTLGTGSATVHVTIGSDCGDCSPNTNNGGGGGCNASGEAGTGLILLAAAFVRRRRR